MVFLNKHSPGCCKPLVNFQSSEEVDSDTFCQFSSLILSRMSFWRFLLSHFCSYHLLIQFWQLCGIPLDGWIVIYLTHPLWLDIQMVFSLLWLPAMLQINHLSICHFTHVHVSIKYISKRGNSWVKKYIYICHFDRYTAQIVFHGDWLNQFTFPVAMYKSLFPTVLPVEGVL